MRRRRRRYGLDLTFVEAARGLPPGMRPGVLGWLRRWRRGLRLRSGRRHHRVFWVMDVVDGGWWEV